MSPNNPVVRSWRWLSDLSTAATLWQWVAAAFGVAAVAAWQLWTEWGSVGLAMVLGAVAFAAVMAVFALVVVIRNSARVATPQGAASPLVAAQLPTIDLSSGGLFQRRSIQAVLSSVDTKGLVKSDPTFVVNFQVLNTTSYDVTIKGWAWSVIVDGDTSHRQTYQPAEWRLRRLSEERLTVTQNVTETMAKKFIDALAKPDATVQLYFAANISGIVDTPAGAQAFKDWELHHEQVTLRGPVRCDGTEEPMSRLGAILVSHKHYDIHGKPNSGFPTSGAAKIQPEPSPSWSEIEGRFKELETPLQHSRLDKTWGTGAAGTPWRIAGGAAQDAERQFIAVASLAGKKVLESAARDPKVAELAEIQDASVRWYEALERIGGRLESKHVLHTAGGYICTGSVQNPASASATLCLEFSLLD